MALPSGYTYVVGVKGSYDSGVLSASDLEIDYLFSGSLQGGWLMGSRNTNSTSSAGQLNVNVAATSYFGYAGARISMGTAIQGQNGYAHIHVLNNTLEFANTQQIWSYTGATTTFTGQRTLYINNINNAGNTSTTGNVSVMGFVVKKGGVLVKDWIPAYRESDGKFGLYDLVEDQFQTPMDTTNFHLYRVTIDTVTGGAGYAVTTHNDIVSEIMVASQIADPYNYVHIKAVAEDGYVFKHWTNGGGTQVISTDAEYDFILQTANDYTIVPVFEKVTDEYLNMSHTLDSYIEIISASVTYDMLQRCTSTFVVKDIPSAVSSGRLMTLRTPKNEVLYKGVVSSIEGGDTIICREPLSMFDRDYIFKTTTFDQSNYTVQYGMYYLMLNSRYARDFSTSVSTFDTLLNEYMSGVGTFNYAAARLYLYNEQNSHVTIPQFTETSTENLEDLILEYSSFGIYFDNKKGLTFEPIYYKNNDPLQLGDNLENIFNVEVTQETQNEDNILIIFNSAGTTLRGMYGVRTDGTIEQYTSSLVDYDQFLGYKNYHGKVIMSNENINTLIAENLSVSGLNHKITFDVQFTKMLPMSMFTVGIPVNFYLGNRMYKSVITAISFEIQPNMETIPNAKITLGNVRTNLTSKLNMGR